MSTAAEGKRIAVAVCGGLGAANGVSDLAGLCRTLEETLPDVEASIVPDLCGNPEAGPGLAANAGATRLVLGVCSDGVSRHETQRWARRVGLDPFGVEIVRLPGDGASRQSVHRATLLLTAAVARMRAFAGTEPEQLRPRLLVEGVAVSRRSLLTLPPMTYEPVASVGQDRCLGANRCRLCVEACPFEALGTADGRVVVERDRCEACGVCVSACPVGAIGLPGSSLPQLEAQLDALLESDAPALLFSCAKQAPPPERLAGWLPVEVPCVGMVTPGWALQALARGARAVGFLSCADGCRYDRQPGPGERVAYVRALLGLLGDDFAFERIQLVAAGRNGVSPPPQLRAARSPLVPRETVRLSEPAATAQALLRLAEGDVDRLECSLVHPASPLGLVYVDGNACTVCGACAAACPTGALRLEQGVEDVVLTFDAGACIGCRRCALDCPEGDETIRVVRVTNLSALSEGRAALKVEPLARCTNCGGPIAPRHMLERLRELLAEEPEVEPLFGILGALCTDCRGLGLVASR